MLKVAKSLNNPVVEDIMITKINRQNKVKLCFLLMIISKMIFIIPTY